MVGVFMFIRPYKEDIVNISSIANEGTLLIIGFYLFIFLDPSTQTESNLRFYSMTLIYRLSNLAWLIITFVVLMVALNVVVIFAFKLYDTYSNFQLYKRYKRLKLISEIEQKYLLFDYRKFFLSSFNEKVKLYHL
jgi:hypothetical protein